MDVVLILDEYLLSNSVQISKNNTILQEFTIFL